ncbi:MAG: zinc metalloprotease HtpX [Ardenticatenia bacterium]|nr:zinc metalloprotease HtpX [Ardenticatenia bacterium]
MRQQWYGTDRSLQVRMFITMFLLSVVYLFFVGALLSAGFDAFSVFLFATLMLGVQYFFSDKIVLFSAGARIVSEREAPQLHALVERLAQQADLPKPKVAIIDTPVPNAFATGRNQRNSVVAVTRGLLETLTVPELEAVLAHELTHIRNRDVMVMTIASFFAMVAQMIMRWGLWWGSMFGDRRRRDGGGMWVAFLVSVLVWIISFILIRALSRYREYAADRGAALLTGSPSALASALVKISGTMQRVPQKDLREVEGLSAFFIVPPRVQSFIAELVGTHPPLEKRLAYLERLQREMAGVR